MKERLRIDSDFLDSGEYGDWYTNPARLHTIRQVASAVTEQWITDNYRQPDKSELYAEAWNPVIEAAWNHTYDTAMTLMHADSGTREPRWDIPGPQMRIVAARVADNIAHHGSIAPYMRDERIREISINAHDQVFVEFRGDPNMRPAPAARFADKDALLNYVATITAALGGRELKATENPCPDFAAASGERFKVIHPDATAAGEAAVSIRRFPRVAASMAMQVHQWHTLPVDAAVDLMNLTAGGASMVCAGGTGSGKTTMLSSILTGASPEHRYITIENAAELQVDDVIANIVGLVTTPAVPYASHVANALRKRPDRIVLGEIREPEEAERYLEAASTGHDGCTTTVHANNAAATVNRLTDLYVRAQPGTPYDVAVRKVIAATQIVIAMRRMRDPHDLTRNVIRVTEIIELRSDAHDIGAAVNPLWRWNNSRAVLERVGEPSEELRLHLELNRWRATPFTASDLGSVTDLA